MFDDPGQRTFAIGVWVTSYSVGAAIGPLAGGALLEVFGWGSVLLLADPLTAPPAARETIGGALAAGGAVVEPARDAFLDRLRPLASTIRSPNPPLIHSRTLRAVSERGRTLAL